MIFLVDIDLNGASAIAIIGNALAAIGCDPYGAIR
jgi:hypothetical protein